MGGGPQQTTNSSPPYVPPYLQPILGIGANELQGALQGAGGIPSLSGLYGGVPQLGVPGLNQGQQNAIGGLNAMGQSGGIFPYEKQAAATMGAIADPATSQQAFKDFAAPEVMQQAALSGQATSGAAPYDLAQAAIPYQLQNQQTELAAAQGQAGLGQQQVANQQSELLNALQASGVSRDVAQQMAQSAFNKQQQQWGFAKDLQTFPFSLFGNTIGGGQTNVSTGGKF